MPVVNTEELAGSQLDWAVAMCEGFIMEEGEPAQYEQNGEYFFLYELGYSTDWALGGPIIERERICLYPDDPVMPKATLAPNPNENPHFFARQYGETVLVAAMRCFVAHRLGHEVDVPDELVEKHQRMAP